MIGNSATAHLCMIRCVAKLHVSHFNNDITFFSQKERQITFSYKGRNQNVELAL
jgi:hypothetical protein